ncbi:hypothetical protein ACFV23_05375, partial [Streptomyces sp. NPDC059627]
MLPDSLDGLFVLLTGMKPPHADSGRIRSEMEEPNLELARSLTQLKDELAKITDSVSRNATGQWSDPYQGAMDTLAKSGVLDQLQDSAKNLADYAHESAYQVDYGNRMIIAQLAEFVFEWALTLLMAIWNPIGALIEQSFLRALYRLILRSIVLRMVTALATHVALNVGLGVAMDLLVRWSMADDGETTGHGGEYLGQAVGFGVVQGVLSPFVPFLGGALAQSLSKYLGRNTVKDLFQVLEKADLPSSGGNTLGKDLAKEADDHLDDGGPVPVPRPAPDASANPKGADGLLDGAGNPDRSFAQDLSVEVGGLVDTLALGHGLDTAGRTAFRDSVGDVFARGFGGDLGRDGARDLGRTWADTLLTNLGRKNLGRELDTVLAKDLPKSAGGGVRSALSYGVAGALSTDWGRKFSHLAGHGLAAGLHQTASEVVYNSYSEHKLDTSFGTFISGVAGHHLSNLGEHQADALGTRVKLAGLDAFKSLTSPGTPNTDDPVPAYDPARLPAYTDASVSGTDTTNTGDTPSNGAGSPAPDTDAGTGPVPPRLSAPALTSIHLPSTSVGQGHVSVSVQNTLAPAAHLGSGQGTNPSPAEPHALPDDTPLFVGRRVTASPDPDPVPGPVPDRSAVGPERVPAAPTIASAAQVRQTAAGLESLARGAAMPGETVTTLSRAVGDAAADGDWNGATRQLEAFRDQIAAHSLHQQLSVFDEQVADGHDGPAALGIPRAQWDSAVEAVVQARHLGDPRSLADSLGSYTALFERHVPTAVPTADGLPRTVGQYQRMVEATQLRTRLNSVLDSPAAPEPAPRPQPRTTSSGEPSPLPSPVRVTTETAGARPSPADSLPRESPDAPAPRIPTEHGTARAEAPGTAAGTGPRTAREESAGPAGEVRVGPVTTPYDAWNAFAQRDPERAEDILRATRSRIPADLGDMDDAVRRAYAALTPQDHRRNFLAQAEMLANQVLTGHPHVMRGGAWGLEAEMDDFELVMPPGSDFPVTLLDSPTIRVAMEEPGNNRPPFIELVSQPIAGVPGDDGRPSRQVFFNHFQNVWNRLNRLPVGGRIWLGDAFPAQEGFQPHGQVAPEQRENLRRVQIVRSGNTPMISPQYTVGVPASGLYDFLTHVYERSEDANNVLPYLRAGQRFGNEIARHYIGWQLRTNGDLLPQQTADLLFDEVNVAALRGHLALVYTQAGALAYEAARKAYLPAARTILVKNFTAVLSRVSMAGVRETLPDHVQYFLQNFSDHIKNTFTQRFRQGLLDDPTWDDEFRDGGAGNFRPLAVVLAGDNHETVDDYLNSALGGNHQVVKQYDAFGGLSASRVADDNQGRLDPRLIPLELRFYGPSDVTADGLQQESRTLEEVHRTLFHHASARATQDARPMWANVHALGGLLGGGEPVARSFVTFLRAMDRLDEALPAEIRDRRLPGPPDTVIRLTTAAAGVQAFEAGLAPGIDRAAVESASGTLARRITYLQDMGHAQNLSRQVRDLAQQAGTATTALRNSFGAALAATRPQPVASSSSRQPHLPWNGVPRSSDRAVDVPVVTDDRMGRDPQWQRDRAAADPVEVRRD